MSREFRRVRAHYTEQNPLLYLALGLLASFGALERLLATYAPERARAAPAGEAMAEMEAVHFVLGLLAVRASVEARLGEAAAPSALAAPTAPAGGALDERSASLWR